MEKDRSMRSTVYARHRMETNLSAEGNTSSPFSSSSSSSRSNSSLSVTLNSTTGIHDQESK